MNRVRRVGLATVCSWLLVAVTTRTTLAQARPTGVFTGVVTRDTLGHPVAGADISLVALKLSLQTNERGEFRFANVPPGTYLVSIRAIGFAPFADSIAIAPGQTLDGDLTLTPSTAFLDTLRSTASRATLQSRFLEEFETRRKSHITGTFFGDSALRTNESAKLSSIVSQFAGARMIHGNATDVFLAAGHDQTDGRPAFYSSTSPCFASVYVDSRKLYRANQTMKGTGGGNTMADDGPPDLADMRASDYSGIEFYASASAAPVQFSATGSSCGVLLLWSRKDRTTGTP
jgi:hypothetical protein